MIVAVTEVCGRDTFPAIIDLSKLDGSNPNHRAFAHAIMIAMKRPSKTAYLEDADAGLFNDAQYEFAYVDTPAQVVDCVALWSE